MPVTLGCFLTPEAHSDEILLFLVILQKLHCGQLYVFHWTCPGTATNIVLEISAFHHHFLQSCFPNHFFTVVLFFVLGGLFFFFSLGWVSEFFSFPEEVWAS